MAWDLRLARVRVAPDLGDKPLDELFDLLWSSGAEALGEVEDLGVEATLGYELRAFEVPAVRADSRLAIGSGYPGRAILRPKGARALWCSISQEHHGLADMWRSTGYQAPAETLLAETARVKTALDGLSRDDLVVAEIWDTS